MSLWNKVFNAFGSPQPSPQLVSLKEDCYNIHPAVYAIATEATKHASEESLVILMAGAPDSPAYKLMALQVYKELKFKFKVAVGIDKPHDWVAKFSQSILGHGFFPDKEMTPDMAKKIIEEDHKSDGMHFGSGYRYGEIDGSYRPHKRFYYDFSSLRPLNASTRAEKYPDGSVTHYLDLDDPLTADYARQYYPGHDDIPTTSPIGMKISNYMMREASLRHFGDVKPQIYLLICDTPNLFGYPWAPDTFEDSLYALYKRHHNNLMPVFVDYRYPNYNFSEFSEDAKKVMVDNLLIEGAASAVFDGTPNPEEINVLKRLGGNALMYDTVPDDVREHTHIRRHMESLVHTALGSSPSAPAPTPAPTAPVQKPAGLSPEFLKRIGQLKRGDAPPPQFELHHT